MGIGRSSAERPNPLVFWLLEGSRRFIVFAANPGKIEGNVTSPLLWSEFSRNRNAATTGSTTGMAMIAIRIARSK
jgi:hypothetical protein